MEYIMSTWSTILAHTLTCCRFYPCAKSRSSFAFYFPREKALLAFLRSSWLHAMWHHMLQDIRRLTIFFVIRRLWKASSPPAPVKVPEPIEAIAFHPVKLPKANGSEIHQPVFRLFFIFWYSYWVSRWFEEDQDFGYALRVSSCTELS